MAGLEQRNGRFNIILRVGGKRFVRSLRTSDHSEALSRKLRVEENVRLVESGRLEIPHDADVVTFLLSDGRISKRPEAPSVLTLNELFSKFFVAIPVGSLEESTIAGMKIHQRHLERVLGKRFLIQQLAFSDVQAYATKRSQEKFRSKPISAATIKKELVSLKTVWKWAKGAKLIGGDFPREQLRLPKNEELIPFQTWAEIERKIAAGEDESLWSALYLNLEEIEELLKCVKQAATLPCLYPMFAVAAYTGARRSEILRCQVSDIDLGGMTITVREKKRLRGKTSTRRVPISKPLELILQSWLNEHPGSSDAFCHLEPIPNSRIKDVVRGALTKFQATYYFNQTLKNSKFNVVKGWHTLRHSFVSNCACKGIDQRMIDEWVGHQTDDMARRYRHLFPSSQRDGMDTLFN